MKLEHYSKESYDIKLDFVSNSYTILSLTKPQTCIKYSIVFPTNLPVTEKIP